jgi:hypothetical protein
MDLPDKIVEEIKERLKYSIRGSIEIIYDESKSFIDLDHHERQRFEFYEPSKGKIGGLGGKVY